MEARKRIYYLWCSVWIFVSTISIQCSDDCTVTNNFAYYEPVYSTSAELKAAVEHQAPRTLKSPGKIYFKDGYLFINETGEGIHIIDNRNPSNPVPIGFLNIPGNYDLAIMGKTLYADSYVDLVSFDISNLSDIKEVHRVEKLFNHHHSLGFGIDPAKGIVTGWKKMDNVTVSECDQRFQPWGGFYLREGIAVSQFSSFDSKAALAPNQSAGIGGSMARFTIAQNHLYALDGSYMDVVALSNPQQPTAKNEIMLSWDIETLFPKGTNLFMGARTGMYIYDLNNPAQPAFVSHFQHVRSCDPVVVEGDYAFVTLRSGNMCGNVESQLQVVNIKDLKNPFLVKSYPLVNPFGLGIDEGTLFICDGTDGLKIYDAKNVQDISSKLLVHYKNLQAFDIIPYQKVAMMIATDGLYQYDYSDIKKIRELSKLTIAKP